MYRLVQKISDLYGYMCIDNRIYVNRKGVERLQELSLSGEVLWQSQEKEIGHYYVNKNVIIFNLYNDSEDQIFDDLFIYNRKTKEIIFQGKFNLYLFSHQRYEGNILYDINEDNIILFDISKGKILEKKEVVTIGRTAIITDSLLIKHKNSYIYIYIKNDFSLLWQKDLSEIASYTDWDGSQKQGEIREIYSYNNTLIVLTQLFILRINLQTGEIIYSLRLPAGLMTLSIEGDKAYGCYGYHYMEIDLEKGELINFVRIENALLNGKEYNAIMNRASCKDGFVFHGLRLEGGQYAVGAINTKTGKREWISPLSVNMVEKIEFHNDKMFILDTGGNLFIYQREI